MRWRRVSTLKRRAAAIASRSTPASTECATVGVPRLPNCASANSNLTMSSVARALRSAGARSRRARRARSQRRRRRRFGPNRPPRRRRSARSRRRRIVTLRRRLRAAPGATQNLGPIVRQNATLNVKRGTPPKRAPRRSVQRRPNGAVLRPRRTGRALPSARPGTPQAGAARRRCRRPASPRARRRADAISRSPRCARSRATGCRRRRARAGAPW